MIFKTIDSSIDSSRKSIALFNKDWNTYVTNLKNASGIKGKAISIISSNDVNCLRAYNQQIANGIKPSEAYRNTMTSCTKEAKQQAVAIAKGTTTIDAATKSIKESTLAAKANKVAMSAMSTALNIGVFILVTTAVSKLISVFNELIHSEENLRQSASDLGSELSNNSSDIEGYKKKIEELKAVINDSSSSFNEVSQARVDLMEIQDELIEKFGTEKGVIESITSAINDQTDALDELSRRTYFQKKNEFNEKTGGDKFADWLSFGNTSDDRIQSNMDKMVSSMRYSFYELKTTGNEVLDNLIAKSYELNIVDDMYGDGKHFQIYGTLDEIHDKLYGIQELSQNFDLTTGFENSFTTISNDVDDALTKFKNLYDQYVLYEKILTDNPDNQYDEQFDLINKAKEAFNEASKLGDENKSKAASDEYAQTLQSAIDLAMQNSDFDVADYFKSMYPELQQMFAEWQFELDFIPNIDGLQDRVKTTLDGIDGVSDGITSFSVEDIENFNPSVAIKEQVEAYGELKYIAETLYGMTLPQLIAVLQELGLVQSESYQQLVDTFGQENVDKLSQEDLKIAYTIENVSNMTFDELQAEIQRIKELTEEPVSLSISQTIDQLNTQLKPAFDSLKSAYQDIYDDDGKFDLQSIDILSTCDSIKCKLDELNKIEGITVDYSAFENLVQVLRNTESTEQDIETAFNSLATSITQAALSGAEDFETMKAALENLGVVNSEMVAFDTLASNAEMLEQALSEATVSMDDFIVNTEDCSVEATKAGQAFLKEKVGTENCAEALSILAFHKELCNLQEMNTSREVANLKTLAENAGYTGEVIQYLTELEQIYQEVASGTLNFGQISAKIAKAASLKALIDNAASNINYEPKVDFSGATKSAKSAGKEAADAYLEAFQKEYDHLKAQSDRGEISEAQYLNALRSLYTRYFKDRKEYLDEFEKYESEYLSGMLDLHNKALSGISTLLNQKISAANDAKDEAISALEEEKEAAADAYQAQIDAIEEEKDAIDDLIKEKEKKIDALNEEADAIQRAAESRKKNIDLQKEEYNLERMLNQRTTAVYKEGEGFVYETDTTGIRDAREKVREAKESLEIDRLQKEADLIQKEIDLLEEKKDALTEEQDAIQKMLDASNMYYDNLIKQQENYWDSMIKNMEQQKSKWEELADIQQIAEAYSAVQQVFGELGYSVEDVLNGSESAFEDFKSRYISIMSDMNQNTGFQEGLEYASGVAKENFGSIVSNAQSTVQELSQTFSDGTFSQAITQGVSDGIVSAKQELDNMLQLGKDAGDGLLNGWDEKSNLFIEATKQTAIDAVEAFAEGQDSHSPSEAYKSKAVDAIDGLLLGIEENKQSFIDTVRTLAEEGVLAFEEGFNFENSTLNTSFDALKVLIESVTEALGIGTEGTVGGLLGALTQLSNFSFSEDSIIKQFNNLKTAIDEVTTAIGGGSESSDSEGQSGSAGKGSGTRGKSSKGEGGGGGSLTDAITSMGETAAEVIGEPDAEGDGTVIGEFGSLKTAVNNVTSAIGSGESEDGKGKGGGEPSGKDKKGETNGNLIGSIVNLGETTDETLGEPGGDGVIGRFEKFKDVIGEAAEHVGSIYQGLIDIDGKTVECTITVNVNQTGGTDIGGTVLGKMNLNSAAYTAKHGKALANGTGKFKGLPKAERNALVSEYGQAEMTVFPNGNTVITNGPTIMDLPKGTIIFNENQTAQLMRNKLHVGSASYTDRTTGSIQPSASEEIKIIPFQPSDKMYDYVQKWNAYFGNTGKQATALMPNSMYERSQQLYNVANQITNSRLTNKNQPNVHVGDIHITCPGVTSKEVAKQVGVELNHMFNGLHLDADQQSRLR